MNKDETPIYEIYVMSEPIHLEGGFTSYGAVYECIGFYYEKETAIRAVEENWCDLQDMRFQAAEIKEVKPGLYPNPPHSVCLYYIWDANENCFKRAPWPKLG